MVKIITYMYVHTKVCDIMDFNQDIATTKLTTAVGWIKGFIIFAMSIVIYSMYVGICSIELAELSI